jgi:hypothetical protein
LVGRTTAPQILPVDARSTKNCPDMSTTCQPWC